MYIQSVFACNFWAGSFSPSYLSKPPGKKKKVFPHQFPINILCCGMVKTLVIFCLLCAGRCGAEGTAPNKLRSPRWKGGVNSEPYSATSLACIHTGICSIMNPNMTAGNWKITTLIGPCGIRSAVTGVHRLHGTIQVPFIWKRNACLMAKNNQMDLFRWDVVVLCWFFLCLSAWREGNWWNAARGEGAAEDGGRGSRQTEWEGSLSTTGTRGPAQLEGLWRGPSHLSSGDKRQMGAHYRTEC